MPPALGRGLHNEPRDRQNVAMTSPRLRTPAALLAAAALTALSACGDASAPDGPSSPSVTTPTSSAVTPSAPAPGTSTPGTSTPGTSTPGTSTATPSPSATGGALTEANLVTAADIPSPDPSIKIEEAPDGRGRSPRQVSICFPDNADLDATAMQSRNFRFVLVDPQDEEAAEDGGPDPDDPSIYTVAWQFADAAAAREAEKTFRGWVADCRKTLAASTQWRPIRAAQNSSRFRPVQLSGAGQGAWADVPIYRARADRSDSGFFETVGLTLVEDRLMVTVDLVYGKDKNTSDQQGGDPGTGAPADRQFDLVKAAAQRLAT